MEGFVTKKGSLVPNWKVRWLSLEGNELRYYKDRNKSNMKGKYLISSSSTVTREFTSIGNNNNIVMVACEGDAVFVFSADTPENQNNWYQAIKVTIEQLGSISGLTATEEVAAAANNSSNNPDRSWYPGKLLRTSMLLRPSVADPATQQEKQQQQLSIQEQQQQSRARIGVQKRQQAGRLNSKISDSAKIQEKNHIKDNSSQRNNDTRRPSLDDSMLDPRLVDVTSSLKNLNTADKTGNNENTATDDSKNDHSVRPNSTKSDPGKVKKKKASKAKEPVLAGDSDSTDEELERGWSKVTNAVL